MFPDCDDLFSEMLSLFPLLDSPSDLHKRLNVIRIHILQHTNATPAIATCHGLRGWSPNFQGAS